jgi:8-oxo-dGTP pyrophosphatase MutT (NUDIX family)
MPITSNATQDPRLRQLAALPWRCEQDGSVSVLLITSRTNRKWMLPKGWGMEGKTDGEAAGREAFEEAGVLGEVSPAPMGSYAYIKLLADGSTKPARAIVFSMRVTKQTQKWPERGQRRRKWMSTEDAAKMVFEPDLARFLSNLSMGRLLLHFPIANARIVGSNFP